MTIVYHKVFETMFFPQSTINKEHKNMLFISVRKEALIYSAHTIKQALKILKKEEDSEIPST